MRLGPVQLLVVGFGRPDSGSELLAELERLRESDVVRVVDVMIVRKDVDGVVQRVGHADEADGDGAVLGALIGLEDGAAAATDDAAGEEFWSLDDAIPDDSAALLALVEHRWAIGTRDAIRAAGGALIADAWIHPADLAAAGLTDAEDAALPDG